MSHSSTASPIPQSRGTSNPAKKYRKAASERPFLRPLRGERKLDWQTAINAGGALCLFVLSFVVRRALKVADDLVNFRIEVAKDYVTHTDLREIKDSLIRIEATLAAKADRH